jgi:hypothetical protein
VVSVPAPAAESFAAPSRAPVEARSQPAVERLARPEAAPPLTPAVPPFFPWYSSPQPVPPMPPPVRLPDVNALHEHIRATLLRHKVNSGSAWRLDAHAELVDGLGASLAKETSECRGVYDLWDNVYQIEARGKKVMALDIDGVVRACVELSPLLAAEAAARKRGIATHAMAQVRVL